MAAFAVYLFCREVDNAVDRAEEGIHHEAAMSKLADLRARLVDVYEDKEGEGGEFLAVRETVQRFEIPQSYFLDLLHGVETDLTVTRYPDADTLLEYCYYVASVVGLIMAKILGVQEDSALQAACNLGTAMQLTNILRDVREDFSMGRVYLPQDDLARFGYSEEDIAHQVVNEPFRALMAYQISRARQYYASASCGIASLPDDGSRTCVRLMRDIYAGILRRIESLEYDVYSSRAAVSHFGKVRIAAGTLLTKTDIRQSLIEQERNAPMVPHPRHHGSTLLSQGQQ